MDRPKVSTTACSHEKREWVAARMLPPKRSWYGWLCLECGAHMDVVGGRDYWEFDGATTVSA